MYNNFNIFVYYFNLIDNVRLLKWSLVAIKMECSGEEIGNFFWKARHLQDCAKSCVGLSSMFIYGTNDFGTDRCKGDGCAEILIIITAQIPQQYVIGLSSVT